MNVKRVLVLGAVCGVLAALLSSAATSGKRRIEAPAIHKTTEVETSGAALASEIARLHDRLRPTTLPEQPGRNLFQFNAGRVNRPAPIASAVAQAPLTAPAVPAPAPAPAPAFKLVGIAEDVGSDGPVRTAIVSGHGELILAKQGDPVTLHYRATQIAADGVDLTNVDDGTVLHLSLR
jgi:hypothetical protein